MVGLFVLAKFQKSWARIAYTLFIKVDFIHYIIKYYQIIAI